MAFLAHTEKCWLCHWLFLIAYVYNNAYINNIYTYTQVIEYDPIQSTTNDLKQQRLL